MKKSQAAFLIAGILSTLSLQAATAVHDYQFNGNLSDSIGSVSLTANGGSLASTPGAYDFEPNQGLAFTGELGLAGDYSIAMRFNFDATTGFRRVVDFKNLTSDTGFYVLGGGWSFYNAVAVPGTLAPGEVVDIVLTRDGGSKAFNFYLNGNSVPLISFIDSADAADATLGVNSMFHFFQDDNQVGSEASAGSVDRIILFDGALAANELDVFGEDANAPVPEPSTWAAGLVGCLLAARTMIRRRKA